MTARSHEPRRVFFPGSFNPFTRGHQNLVERALALFDGVVIAVGVNADKPSADLNARLSVISDLYGGDPRVKVEAFDCLAVDAARNNGCCAILRGVRSVADFEYERAMADVNRRLSGIETVLLYAEPELASVSSSIVRELQSYGVDVTPFLPENKKTH